MTISEQVQNDDRVGVFACPDGIRPVIFLLEAE